MSDPIRLSKRVVALTQCSRTEAEQYIEGGWVRVDGRIVERPQTLVDERAVIELIPGARPGPVEPATLLFHRAASGDAAPPAPAARWADDPTGVRMLERHFVRQESLFPLEAGASGLLIFTQDERLKIKMRDEHGRIEQERIVEVAGTIAPDGLARLCHGFSFEGRELPPIKVSWQSENRLRFATRAIAAGLLEHMCAAVGLSVVTIRRLRIGRVSLAKMPIGTFRYLRTAERI